MRSRTARSETIQVTDQFNLRVLRWEGRAPGFVLVHGLASNAHLWQGVAEALSAGDGAHAITAIDLRGHGESDAPESGYDTSTAAEDVAAVIAGLGLDRPVVAGQSWGGNVVVQLAASHADRVTAIALVDGGWIRLRDSFDSWAQVLQQLTPPDMSGRSWSDIATMLRSAHPDWADWAIAATLANLVELPDGTVRARLGRDHHLSILRSMWDRSVTDFYDAVRVPSLLIPAGLPSGPRHEAVTRAAAMLPGSEVRWYEGADHDVHAQHPDRLAADLLTLAARAGLVYGERETESGL